LDILSEEKPSVVIIVHLYGFIHPDAESVMNYCKTNSIKLIHDAAQSYGIDESKLSHSSGIVYSFGPGKSSTAAGGAILKGLSSEFYSTHCKQAADISVQNFTADLFLKSRIYGHQFSLKDKIVSKIISRLSHSKEITSMTSFQRLAAQNAMEMVTAKATDRKARYTLMEGAVRSNSLLSIPYNDGAGLYFKIVLYVNESTRFKEYLRKNNVPFFSLKTELKIGSETHSQFKEFSKTGEGFVELSTEASLPMSEVKRVSEILKQFS
ncbi:MAG: DegT/DnrJ/EryC1/StrS family aminotransferase, partial [Bacteroidia bacterium]